MTEMVKNKTLNLHNMNVLFNSKFKSLMRDMFLNILFLLLATQVFAIGSSDTIHSKIDTNKSVVNLQKDFNTDIQPGLLSENSASQIRAGLIYDCTTNTIVWEKDLKYAYPIASLTKMMVALIAIEEIKKGNVDWQDKVQVERSYRASKKSKKVTTVKETYTLEGLLKMAMIPSNNEACGMIGKYLHGSLDAFVKRMNERAAELGMTQTFYSNPSGLPAGYGSLDNSSSPMDLLHLANELIKYPEILAITNIAFAEVENGRGSVVYRNHNHLVMDYPGEVDGLKTGYTKNARFCLVATAQKNSHRLVAIALGASNPWLRNQIVSEMLNNYYMQLGIGAMGNSKIDPLIAKADSKTTNAIASSNTPVMSQEIVYKTVTSINKKTHVVKSGQTLGDIASKYNCSINELKKWNGLRTSKIYANQKLAVHIHVRKQVPVMVNVIQNFDACEDDAEDCSQPVANDVKTKTETVKKSAAKNEQVALDKFIYYQVQPGDTLWKISQQYPGTSVEEIKRLNNIQNARDLKTGSKIKVAVDG